MLLTILCFFIIKGCLSEFTEEYLLTDDKSVKNVDENDDNSHYTTDNLLNTDYFDLINDFNVTVNEFHLSNQQNMYNRLKSIFNIGSIENNKKSPRELTIPQFMTDLYYTITNNKNNALKVLPYEASAVVTLPEEDPSAINIFKFHLTGLIFEDVLDAELHLYRIGRETSSPLYNSPYYLLRLYQIIPQENIVNLNPDIHELLNVHYVPSFSTGWQVFKVKRAVESWLKSPNLNLGLLISTSTVLNEPIELNFARKDNFSNKYQPILVVFLKNGNKTFIRETENDDNKDMEKTECSKQPLYINLTKDLFENFIIEPKGYEAYQCIGKCDYPEKTLSSKYSILNSVLNSIGFITNYHCCVPELMKSLIVLYVADDMFVLQQIENMIVQSCSCR